MDILNGVKLGVQSWCFYKFKNDEVIRMLKEAGLDTVEICDEHVNVYNDKEVDEVIKLYRDNQITISSFGINDFNYDEAKARPVFEFAKKAGIQVIGANPEPDSIEMLENLCSEYSIKLAIHNHGSEDDRYGKISQLEEILGKTSQNIGLCLDTGWMIEAGEDPLAIIKKFPKRIYGMHLKDFKAKGDGIYDETVLGLGDLDLDGLITLMGEIGFNGYATLEFEIDPENPLPGIKQCIEQLKLRLK